MRKPMLVLALMALILIPASLAQASFSGQGNRFGFTRDDADTTHMGLINPKTKNVSMLGGGETYESHALSPDGDFVAYTTDAGDIYTAFSDFSDGGPVVTGGTYDYWPAYSPSGEKLVFLRASDGFYIQELGGGAPTEIPNTDGFTQVDPPVWGAKTNRIFFSANEGASRDIYSIKPDGSGLRLVIETPGKDEYLGDTSPDGKRIAYHVDPDGEGWEVFTADVDGTHRKRLTKGDNGQPSYPEFNAAGDRIAYSRLTMGYGPLFWMNLDGTNKRRLTPNVFDRYDVLQYTT